MEFPRLHPKSYEAVQNPNPESTKCDRPKIVKNLAALCAGTVMLFTAYDALTMLQSTMNRTDGIGVISQATLYAFFCVSAMLLPKLFISKFGSKNTSVAAMFAYLPYIASNYYPHWSLMIPSSILSGIAGPLLWASHGVYLNGLSVLYSGHGEPTVEEGLSYKDAKKKSCDDMIHQKYIVPNAVEDCVQLMHSESKDASSLQSHKRLDTKDTSIMRSQNSYLVLDNKYCESKEASFSQSRKRLYSKDTPFMRSENFNMVLDNFKHSESKEASSLQSRKRLDSKDTPFMRSENFNMVLDNFKHSESKEASSLQFRKRLDTKDTSIMQSRNSYLVLDKMKYCESKEASFLKSRKRLDTKDTSIMRSQNSNVVLDNRYCESREASFLQSRKRQESRDTSMMRSHSSNAISESASSNQLQNNASKVWLSSSEHDMRIHQNSNNIPFEGNSEENETKRLVSKTASSLLSSTTAKFFGFHGMAHLTSHVWSSLLSYFTLKADVFFVDFSSNSSCRCGAEFCSVVSECFEYNAGNPGAKVRNILTSICVCMCLISILIVGVFLDALDHEKRLIYFSFDFLNATCAILKRKEMLLLIPLSIHTGLVQGFYVGDFNKSFVACAWGTYHVGLVAVCYGMACGASSLLAGCCVRHSGRRPVMTAAAVVNVLSVVFLLLWTPDSKFPKMFFIASALWGIHVGIVWSQLRAFYGILFPSDEEAAFSAFHLWSGLGFCVAFGFSNFFCISHKLYVILAVSVLGFSGYYTVELIYCKNNKNSY